MMELIYVSHAKKRFSQQDLVDLLTQSRANNEKIRVTGMLLYDGYEAFIQALEGRKSDIANVFEKICNDSRHERIIVLWQNEIETRNFPDWQMGFQNIKNVNLEELHGYSEFMQSTDKNIFLHNNVSFTIKLLRQFKQNAQV